MIERLKEGVTEFVILTNQRASLEMFSFDVTANSNVAGKHRTARVSRIESNLDYPDFFFSPSFVMNIFFISITQLVDYCKSCILIGYATRELLVIVIG